jgi:branched-chain amino acid transport system substrate-binding protein
VNVVSGWNPQSGKPANQAFVQAFTAKYQRAPTMYAAQGYDTPELMAGAAERLQRHLRARS